MTISAGDRVVILRGWNSLNGSRGTVDIVCEDGEAAYVLMDCDDLRTATFVLVADIRVLDPVEVLAEIDVRPWWRRWLSWLVG